MKFEDLYDLDRASSKSSTGKSGTVVEVPDNTPAYEYVNGEPKGILIEEERTNLIEGVLHSGLGVTAEYLGVANVSPVGVGMTSHAYVFPNADGSYVRFGSVSVGDDGIVKTSSVYIRSAPGTAPFNVRIDSEDRGAVTFIVVDYEWRRIHAVSNTTTKSYSGFFDVGHSGGAENKVFYLSGPQLEAGSFPTSYISTAAEFVSRNSTATYIDSNGVLQTAAVNEPRESHVYVDGEWVSTGLLIEPSRANLFTNSTDVAQLDQRGAFVNWTFAGIVNQNLITAPDNTLTADTLSFSGAVDGRFRRYSVSAGVTYNWSYYIRIGINSVETNNQVKLAIHSGLNGSLVSENAAKLIVGPLLSREWQRFDVAYTVPNDGTVNEIEIGVTQGQAGVCDYEIEVWGAQLEQGSYPTSYIPTAGTTVTRAADVTTSSQKTRLADNLNAKGADAYFNPVEGTFLFDLEPTEKLKLLPGLAYTSIESGSGKLGIRYNSQGGEVWANGEKQYDIPYNALPNIYPVVRGNGTVAKYNYYTKYLGLSDKTEGTIVPLDLLGYSAGGSLAMNFATQNYWSTDTQNIDLLSLATFSRPTDKTVWNREGDLVTVPAGQPAFNHDPLTGAALGIDVEESRTNFLTNSNTNFLSTTSTVTTSIFGSNVVAQHINPVAQREFSSNNPTLDNGETACISVYIESVITPIEINQIFGLAQSGVIVKPDGSTGSPTSLVSVGIWQCYITNNTGVSASLTDVAGNIIASRYGIGVQSNATCEITASLWQLEKGRFKTSYIPTAGTTVTRAADICTIENIDQSDWWNPNEGTFVVEFESIRNAFTANTILLAATPNSTARFLQIIGGTGNVRIVVRNSSGTFEAGTVESIQQNTKYKVSVRVREGEIAISINGSVPVSTAVTGDVPSGLTRLDVGQRLGIGDFCGAISQLLYEPVAVSDARLQELSSLGA